MAPFETSPSKDKESRDRAKKQEQEFDEDKLDWIQLRKEINVGAPQAEGLREKIIRKNRENPFVPIGCFATAGVLSYGLWCMRTGQIKKSQLMMRMRVIAQGLTVGALLIGVAMASMKKTDNKTST